MGIQVSTRKGEVPFMQNCLRVDCRAGWNSTPPRLFVGSLAGSQLRRMEQGSSVQLDVTPSIVTLAEEEARGEFRKSSGGA